jgi:nitroimidazol reductase NimA-like FMN-containing flavoprotein (pyridoxamine 5'-phosphate oxidase superfamily)
MALLGTTARTRIRRSDRAASDPAALHAILDEGLVAAVGFVRDGQPVVLPMGYGRDGDRLYLHGSTGSPMFRLLATGLPVCVNVTLLDGLVLARSALHHSMNYRSAVVYGLAEPVEGEEHEHALRVVTEHLVPGRWGEVRAPTPKELAATAVLAVGLEEASVKVRGGPPVDDDADYALPVWAGVVPLAVAAGPPVADPRLAPGIAAPPSATGYRR